MRVSVSASPGPVNTPHSAPVESLSVPGGGSGGGARTATTGGTAMAKNITSSGGALSAIPSNLTASTGRSGSPLPASGSRAGTPMSRQSTVKERKDLLSDQLPLQKGRRVVFKPPPQQGKEKGGEGEEDVWILGSIVACIGGDKNRYTVRDADMEAGVM